MNRAFSAYEEGIDVDPEKEQLERSLLKEYQKKLVYLGENLPDPFHLQIGWLGEENGIPHWPHLSIMDIADYFKTIFQRENIIHRIMWEYKEGKAYRYYTSEFINEIKINNISINGTACVFKTKCVPCQRVRSKMYDVWALVEKESDQGPGGKIISAHCTCPAGLLGGCNHVAGMLFRIEAAVIRGMNKVSCTSELAKWNVPKSKKKIQPGKLSNFLFKQETYKKKATSEPTESRKKNVARKMAFLPMNKKQKEQLDNAELTKQNLYSKIRSEINHSCIAELMEQKKIRQYTAPQLLVKTLPELAEEFKLSENFDLDAPETEIVKNFTEFCSLTEDEINFIYQNTKSQFKSIFWNDLRIGRLTSSNFKSLSTLVNNLTNYKITSNSVINKILGYTDEIQTWQMKHGISNEIHAKEKYKLISQKNHKNIVFSDPGMIISSEFPFLSATPDLEIECSCHGKGFVEIKCPTTVIGKTPNANNYTHLEVTDGVTHLKRTSPYYFQVQGQMDVSNCNYVDFFVFSFEGYYIERISFDAVFWEAYLVWQKIIAPEYLFCKKVSFLHFQMIQPSRSQ